MMDGLIMILREVRDPRDLNVRHDCTMMLFVALIATLCGSRSCVDIADFAAANEAYLGEFVDFPHGAPSHDSFSRLFRLLDPEELARSFTAFAQALRAGLGLGPAKGIVAVDGKRLRGGFERGRSHMPPLMIGVWDAETRLSIAAAASPDGNEVASTLKVLKNLDLKGCVVTADALHCHPKMAEAVLAAGAHYALRLKGNHAPLHACAVAAFARADARGNVVFHETSDSGHDRLERRRASVVAAPADAPAFPGLVMFGRIESERCTSDGKVTQFVHYVAMSMRMTPKVMAETVRAYWGIENNLHRPLDIYLHEDAARTRKNHAPQNLSIIRRMALDILKSHPDKRSVARKMNMARWSEEFFFELFTYMR